MWGSELIRRLCGAEEGHARRVYARAGRPKSATRANLRGLRAHARFCLCVCGCGCYTHLNPGHVVCACARIHAYSKSPLNDGRDSVWSLLCVTRCASTCRVHVNNAALRCEGESKSSFNVADSGDHRRLAGYRCTTTTQAAPPAPWMLCSRSRVAVAAPPTLAVTVLIPVLRAASHKKHSPSKAVDQHERLKLVRACESHCCAPSGA